MSFRDLVLTNRSYRRFHQDQPVALETLRELIDLARQSPSAANRQPLRYCSPPIRPPTRASSRACAWAGYLRDWPGPVEGERPTAYIVILLDTDRQQDRRLRPRHRRPDHPAGRGRTRPGRLHDWLGPARGAARRSCHPYPVRNPARPRPGCPQRDCVASNR